jgi:hypothetical protein
LGHDDPQRLRIIYALVSRCMPRLTRQTITLRIFVDDKPAKMYENLVNLPDG